MQHLAQAVEVLHLLTIEVGVQLHQLINNVLLHLVEAVHILHLPGLHLPIALQGVAVDLHQEVPEAAVAVVEEGINSLFFFSSLKNHPHRI